MVDEASPSERSSTWSWKGFGIGVIGTTIAVGLLLPFPKPSLALPECPHTFSWETTQQAAEVHEFTVGQDDTPEFNDCQRFLVGTRSAPKYDSVFAIFASGRLKELFLLPSLPPVDSFDVSDTVNDPGEGGAGVHPPADSVGVVEPVAIVRAWGSYPALGIRTGLACLLLKRTGSSWTASMVKISSVAACTASSTSAPDTVVEGLDFDSGKLLHVDRVQAPREDVPPVARWGFDQQKWEQYIVIACGAGTCFVGDKGFAREDHLWALDSIGTKVSNLPEYADRVYSVAGWHDVQLLAESPKPSLLSLVKWRIVRWFSNEPPQLEPAKPLIWGSVTPDPGLAGTSMSDFEEGWIPIARVALSAQSDDYALKANFSATTEGAFNLVDACLSTGSNCEGLPPDLECSEAASGSGASWVSRHTNAVTGSVEYYCVKMTPFGSDIEQDVPGTVRWRWLAEDEKLWFRCPEGCCTPE